MKKTTVAAIDFGTSKIVTLVAENSETQRCAILGSGAAAYDGYLCDGWNDPANLNEKILASIHNAEEQSRSRIHEINVGVPVAFTQVYPVEVVVPIKDRSQCVTFEDVRAINAAAEKKLPNMMGIPIHFSPAWFRVDDGKQTLQPVGLKGKELTALLSFVVADKNFVEDVNARMNALGYTVSGFYSTAAGEATLFLPEEDRDRTCMLIDVGYLVTDVMVVQGDAVIYAKTIELGGGNIAADLAIGLDINLQDAEEKIKRKYSFSINPVEEVFEVSQNGVGKVRTFTWQEVSDIILPRVDELAEAILAALDEYGANLGGWSKIYMTGSGLGRNQGGRDYLASKLGKVVREVPKRTASMNNQSYSSTLGLLELIIGTIENGNQQNATGFKGALRNFFRSLLGG